MPKSDYWDPTLEDTLSLIAKIPTLSARIFRNIYFPHVDLASLPAGETDLIGRYANTLSHLMATDATSNFKSASVRESFAEYLRLYITLHSDHEGGNVSAHATHLVGSALGNPFQAYSAGLAGLAAPLHGLANSDVLRFVLEMQATLGPSPNKEKMKDYLWGFLKSGQVIPGYGHAVLRTTDPRFLELEKFIQDPKHTSALFPQSIDESAPSLISLVQMLADVAPGVLKEQGKTANPNPNVDAISGCVLYQFGLDQWHYYTVIFGISRAIGACTQLVWDRALGIPIERPKSITLAKLEELAGVKGEKPDLVGR